MAALLWLRVLPLVVLCRCGCFSEEAPSTVLKDEDPQGDDVATLINEKQEKSWSSCYEDDLRFSPIIGRNDWDVRKDAIFSSLMKNYVVVWDGEKRCKSHAECLESLSSEMHKTANDDCKLHDSFYVGGNGEVYEGRGWHVAPYWHLNGMRRKAITVKFLGNYQSEGPTEKALRAFWRMAKSGVWEEKLSEDYRVVSMGQVYNDSTLVGDALEKVFQESSVWLKEFSPMETWEMTPEKSLPLITREQWGAQKPTKPLTNLEHRNKFVVISEGGERCFTQEECISRMKAEQEKQLSPYGDLVDNFYIGDDGYVYEGRGFNEKPLWDVDIPAEGNSYLGTESITVRFFGNFQSDLPSEKAIGALKLLVNAGTSFNKLIDDYRLYSLRGIYNDSRFLGDRLLQIARKWSPWAKELDYHLAKEPVDGIGFMGMVSQTVWEAKDPTKKYEKIKHPVEFILISEKDDCDRCLNSKECVSLMKKIQEEDQERYGGIGDNFYISDIGNVYEGRGWDAQPQFQPLYFNNSLITVTFIGSHNEYGASEMAYAAFDKLIMFGIKLGNISPNYELYSSGNLYDDDGLLGDGLKKYFENKEKWSKKLDNMTENERLDLGLLPIIPQREWSDTSVNAAYQPYANPVRYVIIGNIGERCLSHEECTASMKDAQGRNVKEIGLTDNFYIGDDGMAYEGRGWLFAPSLYFKGLKSEFYTVTFLGKYTDTSRPSTLSILAFNRLMENGMRTQKLSPDFKIISFYQFFVNDTEQVNNLYNTIKTWHRWTSEVSLIPEIEASLSGNSLLVRRTDWHAEKPLNTIPILEQPLSCVVVHNVGDDCNDLNSCIHSLQTIQKDTPPRYWDVADNFYVGDDGHVYEGRGWDHSSLWATKGIETKILSVGFLGSFEGTPPSPKALLAFQILVQVGVRTGKLTFNFKTTSLGKVLNDTDVVSEKLIGVLKEIDSWSDDLELKTDRARLRSLYSPFVLSDEWNLSNQSIRMSHKMWKPIKYIAIRDGGESCYTNSTCVKRIRTEHESRHASSENGVAENFYVGDDGNVYEGVGWDWDMAWGFNGWQKTVSVQFFGNYESILPSADAVHAFNDVIIKDGIATGKLSPDYRVVPIPADNERTIGNKLRKEVMTWQNAAEEIEES